MRIKLYELLIHKLISMMWLLKSSLREKYTLHISQENIILVFFLIKLAKKNFIYQSYVIWIKIIVNLSDKFGKLEKQILFNLLDEPTKDWISCRLDWGLGFVSYDNFLFCSKPLPAKAVH